MTTLNQKRFKAAMLTFICLQGTAILHFASCINKVEYKYNTRGTLLTLRLPKVKTEAAKKSFIF